MGKRHSLAIVNILVDFLGSGLKSLKWYEDVITIYKELSTFSLDTRHDIHREKMLSWVGLATWTLNMIAPNSMGY